MKHNYFPLINHWKINVSLLVAQCQLDLSCGAELLCIILWCQDSHEFSHLCPIGGKGRERSVTEREGEEHIWRWWNKEQESHLRGRREESRGKEENKWMKEKKEGWGAAHSVSCPLSETNGNSLVAVGDCVFSGINLLNTLFNGSWLKSKASCWVGHWNVREKNWPIIL